MPHNKVSDETQLLSAVDDSRPASGLSRPRSAERSNDTPKEQQKKKSLGARIAKFLFSEVGDFVLGFSASLSQAGLVLIILVYLAFGALLFSALEGSGEEEALASLYDKALTIEEEREKLKGNIKLLAKVAIETPRNRTWTLPRMTQLLDDYHTLLADAIADGYTGEPVKPENAKKGWSLASSLLLATAIMTSIGYGHVAPVTEVGRLVCILYSLLALPMTSIFLIRVGDGVAKGVRALYNKGICVYCGKQREKRLVEDLKYDGPQPTTSDEVDDRGYLVEVPPMVIVDDDIYKTPDEVHEKYGDYNASSPPTMLVCCITAVYLLLGTIIFTAVEKDWSLINSFYCCIVTLTTIGFGDLVPGLSQINTLGGQLILTFSAVYIMIGLAVLGMFFAVVGETIEKAKARRQAEKERKEMIEQRMALKAQQDSLYDQPEGIVPPTV